MQVMGIGRVIFWAGGSLWIGQSFAPVESHSHHAVQIAIGLNDRVQFRMSDAGPWDTFEAAFIPADVVHMFQAPGRMVAHLFCEPESALGRSLIARFGRCQIVGVPSAEIAQYASALHSAFEHGAADEELEEMALDTLYALSGSVSVSSVDPRIPRATEFIAARLSGPLSLADVARHVGLSPGRFRHIFVEETGISFRAFVLWARLNRALELGFGGTSWTDAAYATSFADSAHLSRTMRRMYGLAPSSVRQDVPAALRPMTA
ncbi:AraC family transcriptional regulator [Mesorhizobium sp. VK23B]|uniref:AraC family transcriptional regulator n=1 Tax=Mesorhizobium dulcispinae TaxID=3072316 RepID=A0ABU4XBL3_9HYPH|nr:MULTISPECIES: AraC family transcriptional regulator [unclassified Mesorhizobium]MDX8464606.1 AraC family transcriptional regulator [Mesorhizobium sp. VK23B]MDX8470992.1 AraC family transcriptional regulator [Mesorhizobium sp. VK23A]